MKVYVTERKIKDVDGKTLKIIETHESKPDDLKYIVFLER